MIALEQDTPESCAVMKETSVQPITHASTEQFAIIKLAATFASARMVGQGPIVKSILTSVQLITHASMEEFAKIKLEAFSKLTLNVWGFSLRISLRMLFDLL